MKHENKLTKQNRQTSLDPDNEEIFIFATGNFKDIKIDDLKEKIEQEGLKWSEEIELVDYLVTGNNASNKIIETAKSNGAKIMELQEFMTHIDPNKSLEEWF